MVEIQICEGRDDVTAYQTEILLRLPFLSLSEGRVVVMLIFNQGVSDGSEGSDQARDD